MAMTMKLGADISDFKAKLQEAKKANNNFVSDAKRSLATIGGALGIGFGTAAIVGQVKNLVNNLDQIGKSAKNMGVTAEYFQQIGFAARRSGASTEDVFNAFSRLQRLIGDLGNGEKTAEDAFRRLGITFDMLRRLSPERQFDLVNSRLNAVRDNSERASIANDIYGRSFAKLNVFLRDYVSLSEEARRKGLIVSDENIAKAEELKDRLENFTTALSALAANSGLVDFLNKIAHGVDQLATAIGKFNEIDKGFQKYGWKEARQDAEALLADEYAGKDFIPSSEQINATAEKLLEDAFRRYGNVEYTPDNWNWGPISIPASKAFNESGTLSKEARGFIGQIPAGERYTEKKRASQEADSSIVIEASLINETYTSILDNLNEQIKKQEMLNAGKKRELAIAEAIKKAETDAQKQGVALNEEQRQAIAASAGRLFDLQNISKNDAKLQERQFITDDLMRRGGNISGVLAAPSEDKTMEKRQLAAVEKTAREVEKMNKNLTNNLTVP